MEGFLDKRAVDFSPEALAGTDFGKVSLISSDGSL